MRDRWTHYSVGEGIAKVALAEHCLRASEFDGKRFHEAVGLLEAIKEKLWEKYVKQSQWVQSSYITSDGSRREENRQQQFVDLEIGWEQLPHEDQYDLCVFGIRPITDEERAGLEAEKQRQLQYRKSQYEQLKAEFGPNS